MPSSAPTIFPSGEDHKYVMLPLTDDAPPNTKDVLSHVITLSGPALAIGAFASCETVTDTESTQPVALVTSNWYTPGVPTVAIGRAWPTIVPGPDQSNVIPAPVEVEPSSTRLPLVQVSIKLVLLIIATGGAKILIVS